jgi:hypothetical protein
VCFLSGRLGLLPRWEAKSKTRVEYKEENKKKTLESLH